MDQPRRKRKSLRAKAGGIDIAHADVKIHQRRGVGNRTIDVPGADQQQARAQAVNADINRHRAAAVGAHGVATGARHAAVEHSRLPLAQRLQRLIDDFTLHHPAANGAHNRAVLPDEHLSGVSGGRAPAYDNLRQGKGTVLLLKSCSFCKNIHTNLKGDVYGSI